MARLILDRLLDLIGRIITRSVDDHAADLHKPAAILAEAAHMIAQEHTCPPDADGADVVMRYGECRDAYDRLIALCANLHAERDGPFDAQQRNALAGEIMRASIGASTAANALRADYVALLRESSPGQVALGRLQPRVEALREFAERVEAASARAVQDASLMNESSLRHVRVSGVKGAQAWLQEQLVCGPRGRPPAFDEHIATVDRARRTATFSFGKARSTWRKRAEQLRADLDARVKRYRDLVSLVETARRAGRLVDALRGLEHWITTGAVGAPPRKQRKEGVTARFLAKLEAAEHASESLRRAEQLVETLEAWLTIVVTHWHVAVPAGIALLLVAFTANTLTRTSIPGAGTVGAGWEFFDLAHPERLAALLATLIVAILFFAAQLESVRRRARTLGWWGLGGFALLAFAVPACSAIAMRSWLKHGGPDSTIHWEAARDDLVAKGYDCRRGFHPSDRLGDFVVLACDGSCDNGGDSGLFLPRERLAALEVLGGGVCFRLQDGQASPPTPDAGLAAIAAAIREVGPAQVRVDVPGPDANAVAKLALALGHVGDALASQKTWNLTTNGRVDAVIERFLEQGAAWNDGLTAALKAIGGSLGDAMVETGAEMKLSNCRQSHRLKETWMGRRREDWHGLPDDPCYREYLAAQAERSQRMKAVATAPAPVDEAGE